MPRTTKTPGTFCPVCKSALDCASDPLGDATPKPGDVSYCVYCSAILTFTQDLGLVLAPQGVIDECQEMLRQLLAAGPPPPGGYK